MIMRELLINPWLEEPYVKHSSRVFVANGWEPYHRVGVDPPQEVGQGPTVLPEYKPTSRPERTIHGTAQCWFTRWAVMWAGIQQQVNVPIGMVGTFSVHAHAWCSAGDDPSKSEGEMYLRIGLDFTGNKYPDRDTVIWTDWKSLDSVWKEIVIQGKFTGPECTVFIEAWNKYKLSHADVYVDSVSLAYEAHDVPDPDPKPEPGAKDQYIDMAESPERVQLVGTAHAEPLRDGTVLKVTDDKYEYYVPVDKLYIVRLNAE